MGIERTSYVIIGNGVAGITAAETLRSEDSTAAITIIADDPFPVYYRPALKDYLGGRVQESKLWARPTNCYQQQKIRFLQERVVAIEPDQHSIRLQNGRSVPYSRLLLASGARAGTLTCPGVDLVGVSTLRTVADYQQVLSRLRDVRRAVVTGSGTLALETIETLRHRGYQVTHLIRSNLLWSEVLDQTASDLVLQQEQRDGVDVRLQEEIAEIRGGKDPQSGFQQVREVVTTSGACIPCEMVIIAIGVEPTIDFIKSSGISCGRGVRVDTSMRTNMSDIYAAGDILETTDTSTGRTRVIGQWYPAVLQARAAAYSMLGLLDAQQPFNSLTFYNATFLYGLAFASVRLTRLPKQSNGYFEIVAAPRPRQHRKIILKDGIPVGMLALGDRSGVLALKRAIDHCIDLSTIQQQLADPSFKLNDWLDQQGVPSPILGVKRGDSDGQTVVADTGTHHSTLVTEPQPRTYTTTTTTKGKLTSMTNRKFSKSLSANYPEAALVQEQNQGIRISSKSKRSILSGRTASSSPDHQSMAKGQTTLEILAGVSMQSSCSSEGQIDEASEHTGTTSIIQTTDVSRQEAGPTLVIKTAHGARSISLPSKKSVILGRAIEADILLSDRRVSRQHAEIFHDSRGFYIRDLESRNGVAVNQTRIDNPYLLTNGDCINISSYIIEFVEDKKHAN